MNECVWCTTNGDNNGISVDFPCGLDGKQLGWLNG